jgi:F-type H+-transporting ATPase subunit b
MGQLFAAFDIEWSLLIAQAVNFGIVLVALWYFLYKPVLKTLEERRKVIAQGVADAHEAGEKLAGADSEAAARLTAADASAEEITARARKAGIEEKAGIVRDAETRAARIAEDAERRAFELAGRIRAESEKDIARLALLAAEKLMHEKHG